MYHEFHLLTIQLPYERQFLIMVLVLSCWAESLHPCLGRTAQGGPYGSTCMHACNNIKGCCRALCCTSYRFLWRALVCRGPDFFENEWEPSWGWVPALVKRTPRLYMYLLPGIGSTMFLYFGNLPACWTLVPCRPLKMGLAPPGKQGWIGSYLLPEHPVIVQPPLSPMLSSKVQHQTCINHECLHFWVSTAYRHEG